MPTNPEPQASACANQAHPEPQASACANQAHPEPQASACANALCSRALPTRPAYVLLETVLATGMLILGLAVIGAQIQGALRSLDEMDRRTRAVMLSQQHLAEMDLGLVDLESADNVDEGDFGPRYPNWGWWLITEETGIDGMYMLELQVLYLRRDGEYQQDDFDHENAELVHRAYAFRAAPQEINFAQDMGLEEDEVEELSEKLTKLGIPGLDPNAFDPALLGKLEFEELIETLPLILQAFGITLDDLRAMLPQEVLDQIEESGVFDEEGAGNDGGAGPAGLRNTGERR